MQAVLKAQNTLEEEEQQNKLFAKYESIYREHLPLLKEKFLTGLIEGKVHSSQVIREKIRNYGLKLTGEFFTVLVFSFDQYQSLEKEHTSEELEYLQIGVQDLITETLSKEYSFEVCQYQNNPTVILSLNQLEGTVNQDSAKDFMNSLSFGLLQNLSLLLERIKERINQEYELSVTIGIGKPVSVLHAVWSSYRQASAAVESRFFYGENRVVYFDPNLSGEPTGYLYPLREEQAIISALESGSTEALAKAIDDFFKYIHKDSQLSKHDTHKTCMTLLSNIMHFCLGRNMRMDEMTTGVFKTFDLIMCTETIERLQAAVMSFLEQIITNIKGNNQMKGFVQHTMDYIHHHYQESINLKTIADQIHISPSYLSLLFKSII